MTAKGFLPEWLTDWGDLNTMIKPPASALGLCVILAGVPLSHRPGAGPLYGLRWDVSQLRGPAVLARPSHQLGVIVKQFTFENCEQT